MGSELHFYIHMKPGERVETDLHPAATAVPFSPEWCGGPTDARRPARWFWPWTERRGTPLSLCYNWDGRYVLGPLSPALYELIVHDGSAPVRTVDLTL